MQVSPEMQMTVAFICIKLADGTLQPRGTAFLLGHAIVNASLIQQIYVVTARHVIEGIQFKTGIDKVFVTFNSNSGRDEIPVCLADWKFHAGSDRYVDVAVARFDYPLEHPAEPTTQHPHPIRYWPLNSIASRQMFSGSAVAPGREIGITGLFVHHQGLSRNSPIVRSGTIAAMLEEDVSTEKGLIEAFLIEVRSVGGLSGSPVFTLKSKIDKPNENRFLLLGLIHGHFDQRESDVDISESLKRERINSGIAIVIPAYLIRETLAPFISEDFPEQ